MKREWDKMSSYEKREKMESLGLPMEVKLTLENVKRLPVQYTVSEDESYKEHDLGQDPEEDAKFFEEWRDVTLYWDGSLSGVHWNLGKNKLPGEVDIEVGVEFTEEEWRLILNSLNEE